ncbi:hypothetical protein ACP4OV_009969 [Aristida adscensionis]
MDDAVAAASPDAPSSQSEPDRPDPAAERRFLPDDGGPGSPESAQLSPASRLKRGRDGDGDGDGDAAGAARGAPRPAFFNFLGVAEKDGEAEEVEEPEAAAAVDESAAPRAAQCHDGDGGEDAEEEEEPESKKTLDFFPLHPCSPGATAEGASGAGQDAGDDGEDAKEEDTESKKTLDFFPLHPSVRRATAADASAAGQDTGNDVTLRLGLGNPGDDVAHGFLGAPPPGGSGDSELSPELQGSGGPDDQGVAADGKAPAIQRRPMTVFFHFF